MVATASGGRFRLCGGISDGGSQLDWTNVPAEFQADLAALDKLEDEALWVAARAERLAAEMDRYGELLELKQEQGLSEAEAVELGELRTDADRFMLRKAHNEALLRWRGHIMTVA